jgi:hypothetical protein
MVSLFFHRAPLWQCSHLVFPQLTTAPSSAAEEGRSLSPPHLRWCSRQCWEQEAEGIRPPAHLSPAQESQREEEDGPCWTGSCEYSVCETFAPPLPTLNLPSPWLWSHPEEASGVPDMPGQNPRLPSAPRVPGSTGLLSKMPPIDPTNTPSPKRQTLLKER